MACRVSNSHLEKAPCCDPEKGGSPAHAPCINGCICWIPGVLHQSRGCSQLCKGLRLQPVHSSLKQLMNMHMCTPDPPSGAPCLQVEAARECIAAAQALDPRWPDTLCTLAQLQQVGCTAVLLCILISSSSYQTSMPGRQGHVVLQGMCSMPVLLDSAHDLFPAKSKAVFCTNCCRPQHDGYKPERSPSAAQPRPTLLYPYQLRLTAG